MKCPYCGNDAELTDGSKVYPHREDLYHLTFYACLPCGAWVGTHKKTGEPLGNLANKLVRNSRIRAHGWFDPIWKQGHMKRQDAYFWLSCRLKLSVEETHIANFDIETCDRVVKAVKDWWEANGT